jgi:Tfp pilus assembly protein PilX
MQTQSERGIALVLALFLMTALSVLGASLMFLSQTETYASMNYRIMSQTRYAAEAGVNKAANFLLDGVQYTVPTVNPGVDPLSNYDTTKSPVEFGGRPVILTAGAFTGITANYPVAAVLTSYNAAGQGTVAAGNSTLTYKTYAKLMSMQKFVSFGGTPDVVQTWEVTADGGFQNSRATVRVTATAERPKVAANPYAAFATANVCDAIYLRGNVSTDSYDSSKGPPSGAGNSTLQEGGDVGTNGNLHVQGSVDVNGNLYTARPGVGACTAGAVTGLTGTCDPSDPACHSSMIQGLVSLPKPVIFPIPAFSTMPGTNTVTVNGTMLGNTLATATAACASLGLVIGVNCDARTASDASAFGGAVGTYTKLVIGGTGADITVPNVSVANGFELVVKGSSSPSQKVNINSLNVDGDLTFEYANNDASVIMQFAGKNADGSEMTSTPFNLSDLASWKQNKPSGHSYDASALQIVYGGSAEIDMKGGNSQSAATIYAPNAAFSLQGTQDFFGSVLAKTVESHGTPGIHYDRRLSRQFWVSGQPMMGTFTWQRSQ